jgi:hypothetical protein
MLKAGPFAAGPDHVPNHILRDAIAPHFSRPGDGSKDLRGDQQWSSLPDSEHLDAQHNSLEYFLAPLEEVMEFHWKMF